MPAASCPSLSSIFVKIRNYRFFFIFPKVFNFQCHNLSFRGGYILPESPTKLYGIYGRNDNMHEPVIGQIHPFFLYKIELIPFIIVNLQHKSMRTSRIDRSGPHYGGTRCACARRQRRLVIWQLNFSILFSLCELQTNYGYKITISILYLTPYFCAYA